MKTIFLPLRPRRAFLTSFGLTIALLGMLMMAAISWQRGSLPLLAVGAFATLALAVSAKLRPEWWVLPYRVWNKVARLYAPVARAYILLVCYYTIFPVLRLLGSTLTSSPASSSESAWVQRGTLPVTMYGSQHHTAQEQAGVYGWVRSYASWAMRSRQPWALALLPFLILISLLETVEETSYPVDIYTLF